MATEMQPEIRRDRYGDVIWDAGLIARLVRLWTDGRSAGQIAAELGGISRNAVIGKVTRLGLGGRRSTARRASAPAASPALAAPPARRSTRLALIGGVTKPQLGPQPSPAAVAAERSRAAARIDQPAPDARPCRLLELRAHSCRWPLGDPRHADFRFCGASRADGSVYCACHARLAYQPRRAS
ncbi:GcrA family cell cycle regulator [Rhodoplanes serenus]|nr:GcrA family cell cycle regulator [Rhodoplanes serenus]